MKKVILVFLIGIFFNSFYISAQSNELGIMPIRVKFIKQEFGKGQALEVFNNPSTMVGESIEVYEEKYLEIIDDVILSELQKAKFNIEELFLSELSKEERSKEEEFFKLIRTDQFLGYLGEQNLLFFQKKDKKKSKQSSIKAGPLANIFADHLNRDYLVYTIVLGRHLRTNRADKKKKPYPKLPIGNIEIYGFLIDGNNGKIVEDVFVSYNKNSLGTYQRTNVTLSDRGVENLAKVYVRKWKSTLKKFHKKKKK